MSDVDDKYRDIIIARRLKRKPKNNFTGRKRKIE